MNKISFSVVLISLSILCFGFSSREAHAAGIGFHLNSSGMYYDLRGISPSGTMSIGCGIMVDTAAAKNSIFNYRLKIDYSYILLEANLHRVRTDHAFGFGIVKTEKLRLWLGPKFGFGYAWGEYSGDRKYVYKHGDIFVGAVLGLNIHVSSIVSLAFETGYNYGTLLSVRQTSEETTETATEKSKKVNFKFDQNHPYHEGFVTIGVLFKIADSYN